MSDQGRKRRYNDYGIRPKGSPEIPYDPAILAQAMAPSEEDDESTKARKIRVRKVYEFLIKTANRVLPPKQREIFYSVWVRAQGNMSKGIMEYSRKKGQSHYTNYNNYYKALASVQAYLERSGYADELSNYLLGRYEDAPVELSED